MCLSSIMYFDFKTLLFEKYKRNCCVLLCSLCSFQMSRTDMVTQSSCSGYSYGLINASHVHGGTLYLVTEVQLTRVAQLIFLQIPLYNFYRSTNVV
jgi:hypothetical protein